MELNRLVEQRIPLAAGFCAFVAAVSGAVLLVPSTEGRIAMAAGVLLFVVIASEIQRIRELDSLLYIQPRRKADLTAQRFGAKASAIARERFPHSEPPYVRRPDFDGPLDAALRSNRFVVVRGVTNSGKTRAVFEAIGRVLPGRRIVVPNDPTEGGDALGRLLEKRWLLRRRGRYVLVINDLENRLSALQGFAVRNWLKSHPGSRIVATLSAEHWAELLAKEQTPTARAAAKLLGTAEGVPFDGEFKGRPLAEARRLYGLPHGQTRLGSFLASADRAIADFEVAREPKHAAALALALSGINCARAGLVRPIELDSLVEMARQVSEHDGRFFADEEWRAAIEFCTRAPGEVGAILETSPPREEGEEPSVTANPALVERVDLDPAGKPDASLPGPVWKAILDIVAEGPYDLLRIATAAAWRGRPDLAETLFEEVAESGGTAGRIAASRLKEPDRIGEAPPITELLERSAIGPNPRMRGPQRNTRTEPERQEGAVFDSSIHRAGRWRGLYRHQGMRDVARFALLLCFDVLAICAGFLAAQRLGAVAFSGSEGLASSSFSIFLVAAGLVLVFFLLFGLYRADRERARLGEIIKSTALAAAALSFFAIEQGYAFVDLPLAAAAAVGAGGLAFLLRWSYDRQSRAWVKANGLQSRVLLVASKRPTATAELILNGCRRPMQMVGYLSARSKGEPGHLGTPDELERVADEYQIDRVIIADPDLSPPQRLPLIYQCHALDLATEVVPNSAELFQGASDALDDMSAPLVRVRPLYLNYVDKRSKQLLDLAIALPLSLVAFVLLIPIAIWLKLRSFSEPLLTWDYRPGLGAIVFRMWRLRTERGGSVTKSGRILERLRINEIPQLLNVLEGNMSLVGPRPLSLADFDNLDDFQRARYAVLPGITGLWQVARREESSLDDMNNLDIVYCRKWTPLLDLTILLLTAPAVLRAPV